MRMRSSIGRVRLVVIAAGLTLVACGVDVGGDDEFVIKNVPRQAEVKDDAGDREDKPKPRKCFRCHGSGLVTVATRETCDRCEGTGVVVSEVELKDTIHHSGSYWWGGGYNERSTRKALNKQPCPRCKRQGKVAVKKDVECTSCRGAGWLLNGRPCFDHNQED